jgi:hypothetical protein
MLGGGTILDLHGGWFNWGSAEAFRHLVGHIAQREGSRHSFRTTGWPPNILSPPQCTTFRRATAGW